MKALPHKVWSNNALSSFVHSSHELETTKMSISRWMDKLWYTHPIVSYWEMTRNNGYIQKPLCSEKEIRKSAYSLIPFMQNPLRTNLSYGDRRSVAVWGQELWWGDWEKGHGELFGLIEMFFIVMVVVFTWVYTFVKALQRVGLK